jgi:hypothetical protein
MDNGKFIMKNIYKQIGSGLMIATTVWLSGYTNINAQTMGDKILGAFKESTVVIDFFKETSLGKLTTCGLEYKSIVKDEPYKLGRPVILVGSLIIPYSKGKKQSAIIKVKAFDISISQSGKLLRKMFEIPYAYLRLSGKIYAGKEFGKLRCEDGGFCAVYVKEWSEIIISMIANKLEITYMRREGGPDVTAKIDID